MPPRRAASPIRPAHPARPSRPDGERLAFTLGLLAVAVLAAWVQRRALGAFFGPDDLLLLERAAGLRAAPPSLHRSLSQPLYFWAMFRLFGPEPLAFHLAGLLAHVADVVLLGLLLVRAGLSRTAALLAAGLFGCHPLVYTSLVYAVNANDVFALGGLLLAALALFSSRRSGALLAAAAFAAGLLCKESILLLPLALLFAREGPLRERLAGLTPLIAVALAFGVVFAWLSSRHLTLGGEAYATTLGWPVVLNAGTYLRWLLALGSPLPDLAATPEPGAWRLLAAVAAGLALVAWRAPSLRRPIALGSTWFVASGLPVFVLAHHMYAQYLYGPLAGLAIVAAALFDSGLRRLPGAASGGNVRARVRREAIAATSRNAGVVAALGAGALVLALAWQANTLVARRVALRLPMADLPADPLTRKMAVAERTVGSMREQRDPAARRAILYSPPGPRRLLGALNGRTYQADAGRAGYDLFAEVLDRGAALRVFFPTLEGVEFRDSWSSSMRSAQLYWRRPDATLVSFGTGAPAVERLGDELLAQRRGCDAAALAESLAAAVPTDTAAIALRARAAAACAGIRRPSR
jgi:hypothetical protein